MEKDVDLIIPIEPEEARLLIELLEQLFEEWYVARHKREQRRFDIQKVAEKKKQLQKLLKSEQQ